MVTWGWGDDDVGGAGDCDSGRWGDWLDEVIWVIEGVCTFTGNAWFQPRCSEYKFGECPVLCGYVLIWKRYTHISIYISLIDSVF